nr:retrotransposon protein, putative, unclassified [Tanacetum cinerariifolium]
MIDYSLWEVVKNGNIVLKKIVGDVKQVYEPTSAEEKLERKNEIKARATLLMALPNKDQMKFHSYQDAKLLMAVTKTYQVEIETISSDDLYNNFKIYEYEIIGSSSTSQNLENVAFVSSNSTNNTNSTNKADNTAYEVSTDHSQCKTVNSTSGDNLYDAVISVFLASQRNSPQLAQEDLEQLHPDDLEEIDLQWEMAMLTIRARRFPKNLENKERENDKRTSYQAEEEQPTNYALIAYTSSRSSSNSDFEVDSCSKSCVNAYTSLNEQYDNKHVESEFFDVVSNVTSSKHVNTVESNHDSAKYICNTVESNVVRLNNASPSIINDWNFDDESEVESNDRIKIVRPSTDKTRFVKTARETVEKVGRLVWNNSRRVNHKNFSNKITHPHPKRSFVSQAVLTRSGKINTAGASVNNARGSVNTVGANVDTVFRLVNTTASTPIVNHPRPISNTYNRGYSQILRPFNRYFANKNNIDNKNVNTTRVKDTIARERVVLLDESQVLLRVPRKDNIYSVDLKSVVPTGGIENQLDHKVKVIWCNNGTEFKNSIMNQFCKMKGIKREFSVARTPRQNGVAERENRTLIEVVRTMDHLSKFDGKADEGYFVRYSVVRNKNNVAVGQVQKDKEPIQEYILIHLCTTNPSISQDPKDRNVDAKKKANDVDESGALDKDGNDEQATRTEFEKMMHDKFQMSYMGELSFFLGLQVQQKNDGIFISQDKYMAKILKKFNFANVKTASTLIEPNKALIKDEEAEEVDVHESTTRGCQFLGKRLISWQCKKQTIDANSTTEAAYVAAANRCGQKKQKPRKRQRKETEDLQDEAQHKENIPTSSNDPQPSGKDSMQLSELMILCTNLQQQVLDLEKAKDAQSKEIAALKKRVQKLEKRKKSRPTRLRRLRKVDLDADAEVTLINETQDDDLMFDVGVLDDEVVVAGEKEEQGTKVNEMEVSTAKVVTTIVERKIKAVLKRQKLHKIEVLKEQEMCLNLTIQHKTDEHEEVEEDDEAKVKKHTEIVREDDIPIDAIPLASKPPMIVEYKIVKEGIFGHF